MFKKLFQWVLKTFQQPPLSGSANFVTLFSGQKVPLILYRSYVFACVRAIVEEVCKMQIVLYKKDSKGNKQIIEKHPALDLLKYVNPFFTYYFLIERLQSNLELKGNEYWFLLLNAVGIPVEIFPLMPESVTPISDPKTYVKAYKYTVNGESIIIPAENIIHFRNFNPHSDIIGMSTLEAARDAAEMGIYAKKYNKKFFENSAIPNLALKYPGQLKPEEIEKIKRMWESQFMGLENGHKLAVLQDGVDIEKLESSFSDMQFSELNKEARDEVLAVFRVPKTILGIIEESNFAAAKTANYTFILRTIEPKMKRIINILQEFYIPLWKDESLEIAYRDPVPEDREELINYYNSGINNGYLSPNDVRRKEGLPELEDGETLYLPSSLFPYTQPKTSGKSYENEDDIIEFANKLAEKVTKQLPEFKKKSEVEIDEAFEIAGSIKQKANVRRSLRWEKLFAKTSQDLFEDQKARAIKNLENDFSDKTIKVKIPDLLDEDLELEATMDLFEPLFRSLTEEEGQNALRLIGINPDKFNVDKPTVSKFILQNLKKFAGQITETTSQKLREEIGKGLEAGEAIKELTERIENFVGFDRARSEMIARTEVARGQGETERLAWKESGVVKKLKWFTAQDERVDEDYCAPLHGKVISIDDAFLSSEDLADMDLDDYTGNGIESPPLHPNCRCTILPVIKGKSYSMRERLLTIGQKK
ncbi:MAG: phage portal protein [Spirochaetes bacterium]|nr:MAG: phage portal protein [Spirochaetota bacterium]